MSLGSLLRVAPGQNPTVCQATLPFEGWGPLASAVCACWRWEVPLPAASACALPSAPHMAHYSFFKIVVIIVTKNSNSLVMLHTFRTLLLYLIIAFSHSYFGGSARMWVMVSVEAIGIRSPGLAVQMVVNQIYMSVGNRTWGSSKSTMCS